MRTYVFLSIFALFILMILSLQRNRNKAHLEYSRHLDNRIDTFKSENYIQIVNWNNGIISKIRIQQIAPNRKEGIYLMSQDLDFDNRGVLDSLYMFHGRKMVPIEGGRLQGNYQSNYAYFDSLGNVLDFRFMRDFRFEYEMKK